MQNLAASCAPVEVTYPLDWLDDLLVGHEGALRYHVLERALALARLLRPVNVALRVLQNVFVHMIDEHFQRALDTRSVVLDLVKTLH